MSEVPLYLLVLGAGRKLLLLLFFFTLVTGPRRSLSLKRSDTRVYEPQIPAGFGRDSHGVPAGWGAGREGELERGHDDGDGCAVAGGAAREHKVVVDVRHVLDLRRERIFIALMTSDRKLKASREGSK